MKIRIGRSQISFSMPLLVAKHKKLFEEKGLEVVWNDAYDEAESLCEDVAQDKIDVGGYVALPIIFDMASRYPGKIQYSHPVFEDDHKNFVYLLAQGSSNIKRIKDLKGKRIGIFPTEAFKLWMETILEKEKISLQSVKLIMVDPVDQQKALKENTIDALLTNDPTASHILRAEKDILKVYEGSLLKDYIYESKQGFLLGGVVFSRAFLKQHPKEAQMIYDVISQAIQWIEKNPKEAETLTPEITTPILSYVPAPQSNEKKILQKITDIYYHNGLFQSPINSRLLLFEPYYELKAEKIGYKHGELEILKDISFQLKKGDFATIFGPNGSGKTTLLHCLSGLKEPEKGSVHVNGESIADAHIGYVYQNYRQTLMPWKKVHENISFCRKRLLNKVQRKKEVEDLCAFLNIELPLDEYPQNLSGGQQQMVALMMALIEKPEILLLDEPFAAIDYQNTLHFQEQLQNIQQHLGLTVICVSHDLDEAIRMGNTILLLSHKPTVLLEAVENSALHPRTIEWMESDEFLATKKRTVESSYMKQS